MSGTDDTTLLTGQAPPPEAQSRRIAVVFYHRDGAEAVALRPDVPLVVGRAAPSNVVLPAPRLSRRHARFVWDSEGVLVEDLGSTNGTFVDGERIERRHVAIADEITLGGVVAVLQATDGDRVAGADSDDLFTSTLTHEVTCARHFGRELTVALVRVVRAPREHIGAWLPLVRSHLRVVDRVATYGQKAVLLLFPEQSAVEAADLLDRIVVKAREEEVVLVAGLASLRGDAANAHELIARARDAAMAARPGLRLADAPAPMAPTGGDVIAESEAMRAVLRLADRVAPAELPVLLTGETGSGKEVLAGYIHQHSARGDREMMAVNCATIPKTLLESTLFGHEKGAFTGADDTREGLFASADGGTVFLDEIGELAPEAQAALLRVLETKMVRRVGSTEEHPVDVRVIAATHRDLEAMCGTGEFRWDLYFRLAAVTLVVPPLRDRREEVELLANRFLSAAADRSGTGDKHIHPDAMKALAAYAYPGNVRELKNAMERAAILAETSEITLADLPGRIRAEASDPRRDDAKPSPSPGARPEDDTALGFRERAALFEKRLIIEMLEATNGNQSEAARRLDLPRRTLVHKLKAHDIKRRYGS